MLLFIGAVVVSILVLAYLRLSLALSTVIFAVALTLFTGAASLSVVAVLAVWFIFLLFAIPLNFSQLRRRLVSDRLFQVFARLMPSMSVTEREALEAGTVGWDAELFSGKPTWKKLFSIPSPRLTSDERAFLEGPTEELCRMLNDWRIVSEQHDLPPEVWQFLKHHRFFGMIIPKQYGGLEFTALGHSAVVMKIASRSITAAVTVMVPNSLGPAELLLEYGTEDQKNYYLPRLARGEEIPCFALTGPEAGSDAAGMLDTGVVCRTEYEGKPNVLGVRLNWDKRYITLGPVATVLGVAFKLYDPERLLGGEVERGITLALIPTNTPGITIGRRHDPLGVPFQNGPNQGHDVFVPLDWLIGGREYIGRGWRMLMESLAAGRSISLPALSTASGKLVSRATGAYAHIRKQFNLPIGRLEGVEEVLARIAGNTYLMDAARTLTLCAVDQGERPAVASAIVKYQLTERMRNVINDAMDIHGGSGICLGPRNVLGRAYQSVPIGITVEGANILTRSLIIYGQGAVRCHPYVLKEMEAVTNPDNEQGRKDFDAALFGHIGLVISNMARAFGLGLSDAYLAIAPVTGPVRRHIQQLTRFSAAFAFVSDVALAMLGGTLKRKEKLSGRLADVLSHLYLASAVLKRFEDQGRPEADEPLLNWACADALYRIQQGLDGVLQNLPNRPLAALARFIVFPFGRRLRPPSDDLGHRVASLLLTPSTTRDRLTAGIFIPTDPDDPIGRLEDALPKVIAAEAAERKLQGLPEIQLMLERDFAALVQRVTAEGVLTSEEGAQVIAAQAARREVITVDDFPPDDMR